MHIYMYYIHIFIIAVIMPADTQRMSLRSVLLMLVVLETVLCRPSSSAVDEENDLENEILDAVAAHHHHKHYRDMGNGQFLRITDFPPENITAEAGSYVELACEAMGSPPPTIQWFKGEQPLTQGDVYETNELSEMPSQALGKLRVRLVINHLLTVHRGEFRCVVENGGEPLVVETRLRVISGDNFIAKLLDNWMESRAQNSSTRKAPHHPPKISMWAPSYMEVLGANVILPCRSLGNPTPTLKWVTPKGYTVPESDGVRRISVLPEGQLSIRALKWEDMGVYKCYATNSVGQDKVESFVYPMLPSRK